MDSSQDKITTMHSAYHAVCKLPGRVLTPLVVKFYYAHGAHLTQQSLVNTFDQVHHAWLYLISAVLNRLNTCLRAKNAPGIVAQYLAAIRHKNTHLTLPIPVTAVQSATLLTDCGRKQTRVSNLDWLVDTLAALNVATPLDYTPGSNLKGGLKYRSGVWMGTLQYEGTVWLSKLANVLKADSKLAKTFRLCHKAQGITTRKMHVVCAENTPLTGPEYQLNLRKSQRFYGA